MRERLPASAVSLVLVGAGTLLVAGGVAGVVLAPPGAADVASAADDAPKGDGDGEARESDAAEPHRQRGDGQEAADGSQPSAGDDDRAGASQFEDKQRLLPPSELRERARQRPGPQRGEDAPTSPSPQSGDEANGSAGQEEAAEVAGVQSSGGQSPGSHDDAAADRSSGRLPVTGLGLALLLAVGGGLLVAGVRMRRAARDS